MTTSQALKHERKGSFFKLIDSFASEIGMLKKEMGKKTKPSEEKKNKDEILGLGEEVGGLFLQASPCAGIRGGLDGARDSGYDSLHRRLSVLDRLVHTHAVWLQLGLSHQEATCILQSQPTGTFVVRKSASLQRKVISLRMDKDAGVPVKDFLVKENQYTFALEGSGLSFADLFRLVAFCCISRDVLPFTLKLPEAIASARSPADLEEVSKLGAGFWDAHLSHRRKESGSLSGITAPDRPAPPAQRSFSLATTPRQPWLQTRTPSEIECCQSNGALCFINPLFLKVHHRENENRTTSNPSTTAAQDPGEEPEKNNPESTNRHIDHSGTDSPQVRSEDQSGSTLSAKINPESLSRNIQLQDGNSETSSSSQPLSACVSRSPPPRPPPPRFAPRQSAAPLRQRSMPEKIPWIIVPKEKMEGRERSSSLLSRLSSSLSSSPSSSPPKKLSISSPISIPLPCLSISLSSLSSSQRWSKTSPTSSQEDAQCHLALEENTIEKALLRAKLLQTNFTRTPALDSSSPPDPSAMKKSKRAEVAGREDSVDGCTGCQRLSDMSISTDSSDSLDLSQSSAFFLPPLHDPCLPTVDDFNTHLPLSLPPSHLPYPSMEEEEDDDDDEDEEDQDYDVSLESDQDQDQDLTMVPPGKRTKRRHSPSALVLQKALRGKFRKMSGIFNSLLTPERRAIRRVVELSKHRGSYFGCLVHDYLSYMGEGAGTQAWQSYASGLELLQTVRQFITQMKSYLRQSSELEPPIESLIPEDHIDRVLEKSLHKCILKPLKSVVSVALKEFQVRSGEWQELKENLSLAKQRQPQEMGVSGVLPPDRVTLDKIKQKFREMVKEYSPEKKVIKLLSVCKLIYNTMQDSSGRPYGADDFLPMLTYVLAQCDMPQLDNEILYMMELLDPSLLHGEGGYYLTSAYGAMSLIRHFQEEQAARMLSSETRDTLHQWHHRRTTIRSAPAPSIDDFQNYLRVALQELDNGCTAKTLPVRPHATVEEVCQLCANKFKVTDPESYGLFLVTNGSSQQLAPDNHPQKIKAELHSRSQANPFYFVFRTVAYGNPSASAPANLNELPVNSDPLAELNSLSIDPLAPSSEPSLSSDLSPSLSLSLSPSHSISV